MTGPWAPFAVRPLDRALSYITSLILAITQYAREAPSLLLPSLSRFDAQNKLSWKSCILRLSCLAKGFLFLSCIKAMQSQWFSLGAVCSLIFCLWLIPRCLRNPFLSSTEVIAKYLLCPFSFLRRARSLVSLEWCFLFMAKTVLETVTCCH